MNKVDEVPTLMELTVYWDKTYNKRQTTQVISASDKWYEKSKQEHIERIKVGTAWHETAQKPSLITASALKP